VPGGDRGQWLVVEQRFAVDGIAMYPSEAKASEHLGEGCGDGRNSVASRRPNEEEGPGDKGRGRKTAEPVARVEVLSSSDEVLCLPVLLKLGFKI